MTPTSAGKNQFTFEDEESDGEKSPHTSGTTTPTTSDDNIEDLEVGEIVLYGQWFRRRRLDGALNRVPIGFYSNIWSLLSRCDALSIYGQVIPSSITKEMTQKELKFALSVEATLNRIPDPSYRQLFVEALSILSTLSSHDNGKTAFRGVIQVDYLIVAANDLFLADQSSIPNGSAKACCASESGSLLRSSWQRSIDRPTTPICHGPCGICAYFYDSAPSGKFGTVSYISRAVIYAFPLPTRSDSDVIDCPIQ